MRGLVQRGQRAQKLLASVFDRHGVPNLPLYCCISARRKSKKYL